MNSNWVSVTGIPLIVTPTPAAASTRNLQRNGSARLRLNWNDLDVNNGGSGSARVTKNIVYDIQHREVSGAYGPATRMGTSTNRTITGLANGTFYEARIRGIAIRSDATNTEVEGPWSTESNQEKPVKDTVTLTYGVANTRDRSHHLPKGYRSAVHRRCDVRYYQPVQPGTGRAVLCSGSCARRRVRRHIQPVHIGDPALADEHYSWLGIHGRVGTGLWPAPVLSGTGGAPTLRFRPGT